jgi:hypothetical protein
MQRIAFITVFAVAALAPLVKAEAVVTFDPNTGTGYVDASVVTANLGWSPEQLQEESAALGFVLTEALHVTASCNNVPTAQITDRTDYLLAFSEQRDNDGTLQGFTLSGRGRAVGQPALPPIGSECGASSSADPQVWTAVEEDSREDRVYVAYQGLQVLLWPGSGLGILREPIDEREVVSAP